MSGFMIHGLRRGPVVLQLAIAILLAGCDPRPTVMTPQYRFVDPRLRASGDRSQGRKFGRSNTYSREDVLRLIATTPSQETDDV